MSIQSNPDTGLLAKNVIGYFERAYGYGKVPQKVWKMAERVTRAYSRAAGGTSQMDMKMVALIIVLCEEDETAELPVVIDPKKKMGRPSKKEQEEALVNG